MITEKILEGVLFFIRPLLEKMPDIDFSFTLESVSTIIQIICSGAYFMPVGTVVLILFCILTMQVIRIIIAFMKTVMHLIPFV